MESTEPAGTNPPQDAPLSGIRVLDLSRLAPGPFCSFLLADLGADVTVVLGPGGGSLPQVSRGKRFVALDLKSSAGRLALQRLAARADVLIEGFRPGVADRLGAGYDTLRVLRPELIYCSITGYGQDGPLAQTAGHDINYLAQAGLLGAVGPSGSPPLPPLNLLADFAGGSFLAAIAILAALVERSHSGLGQHLDVAMVDGVQSMMTMHYATWGGPAMPGRGEGLLAGTAPFYRCYECADGRYVAVGALEAPFFAALWRTLGLADFDPRYPTTSTRIAGRNKPGASKPLSSAEAETSGSRSSKASTPASLRYSRRTRCTLIPIPSLAMARANWRILRPFPGSRARLPRRTH